MSKPQRIVHLDFETASAVDLPESGVWEYASHPSTSVLCAAYATNGTIYRCETNRCARTNLAHLNALARDPDTIFYAYNAFFERMIWQHVLVKRHGFPEIPLHRWRCSSARALIMGAPKSLDAATRFLDTPIKKDKLGHDLMMRLCHEWEHPELINPTDMRRLAEYCAADVEAEMALDNKTVEIPSAEQQVWQLDQIINERGVLLDRPALMRMREIAKQFTGELNVRIDAATSGHITKVTQIIRLKKYLETRGHMFDSLDKASIADALADPYLPEDIKSILMLRAAGGKSSNAKLGVMLAQSLSDSYARGALIYHGASTGRWTSQDIQLQNLPKGIKVDLNKAFDQLHSLSTDEFIAEYGDKTALVISSLIRGTILPPPGKKLLVADFSAIEARVVCWLAGSETGISRFRDYDAGLAPDAYVLLARDVYEDNSIEKATHTAERDLGKEATLGFGFGMGITRFEARCAARGLILPPGMAQKAHETYHEKLPEIRKLWTGLEKAARHAVTTQTSAEYNGIRYTHETIAAEPWLSCTLPSGRKLWYFRPNIELVDGKHGPKMSLTFESYDKDTKQSRRETIWGGTLTENVVQAIARDLMVQSAQTLEATGRYQIVLTVHDELIAYGRQSTSAEEMRTLMRKKPIWAATCPTDVEAKEKTRYGK